ncbi:BatD family protein [Mesonia sp. HuA40]|uniref:BatD family protein n=1 Tax=Mesonia sp. HuA40 TaxID=2602761 RepID=UPI0011CA9A5B|nr:BatD family protein [Mesonia sp. HuA40]TXK72515.1 protein BatD [Mesonia sp. HuA40]
MRAKLVLFIFQFLFISVAWSQVKFEAEVSRNSLGLNERLRVDFVMNQEGDNFKPPAFKNFTVVGGPYQSISNSYINGKRSFKKSYGYYLEPNSRGKLEIGQAEVLINGQTYKTSPVTITVSAAVDQPNQENTANKRASQGIHLVTRISNEQPYLNEGISVEYVLYISPSVNISNWRPIDNPKFADFWSQNIDIKRLEVKEGTYLGEPYRYVTLRKTVLYPQKTGELSIEPLTLSLSVDVLSDRRDFFGRRLYETIDQRVSAKTRTIKVKPLPTENRPANFNGAVGDFKFNVLVNKKSLQVGESLEAKVQVFGKGNLKLFQLPKLVTPSSLEVYEPEHIEEVRTTQNGMQGKIFDNYTLVPQTKGKYPIPALSFSYFDPQQRTYKTLTAQETLIEVEGGVGMTSQTSVTTNQNIGIQKNNITQSREPFRFLKLNPAFHEANANRFFRSLGYWLLFLTPLYILPLLVFLKKKRANSSLNAGEGNASKLVRKYLNEAHQHKKRPDSFYVHLERALYGFIRTKLKIANSDLNKEKVIQVLEQHKVEDKIIEQFITLLKNCEMARYTPLAQANVDHDFEEAKRIVTHLDKKL